MSYKITVTHTQESLFDFLLYHTYSRASGFLINVLGFAVFLLGALQLAFDRISLFRFIAYLLASFAFLGYTPLQLKLRAKKQLQSNPLYAQPKEFTFSEDGICVSNGTDPVQYPWSKITHTVTTPKNIGFYYGADQALIVPKSCFGSQFVPIMQLTIQALGRHKVRLR